MYSNYNSSVHRNQGQSGQYNNDSRRGRYSHGRWRNSNQLNVGERGRVYRPGGSHDASRQQRVGNDDDDVIMGEDNNSAVSQRYTPYNYRSRGYKGRPHQRGRPRGTNFNPRVNERIEMWTKVILPMARKIDKDILLKTIADHCPVPLVPYNFCYRGQAVVFHIKDMTVEIAIRKMIEDKVTIRDFKIKAILRKEHSVTITINEDIFKSLKNCVAQRYSPETFTLNLQRLHEDFGLIREGCVAYFKQEHVMQAIAKIINVIIPQIHNLDLRGNELLSCEHFVKFINKNVFSHLRVLDLSGNRIEKLNALDVFGKFPVQEINLTDNQLFRLQRKDRTEYLEGIRKRFPKLLKLDGQELPPQIGFDVENPVCLPETRDSYFMNEHGKEIAINFFQRYFSLYDSNREGVADAYSNSALFSLVTTKNDKQQSSSVYLRNNRNLSRIRIEDRLKYLFTGKFNIMHLLTELPKTQHDASSMTLDVIFSNNNFTSVTISGVYRDLFSNIDSPLRGFTRSFILIPVGGGFKIINEMLLITAPTDEQRRISFKIAAPTPSTSHVPFTSTADERDTIKRQMVVSFSLQSGMNPEWSLRCLHDLNWDFDKAAQAFTDMNAKGRIPPEAFAHIAAP